MQDKMLIPRLSVEEALVPRLVNTFSNACRPLMSGIHFSVGTVLFRTNKEHQSKPIAKLLQWGLLCSIRLIFHCLCHLILKKQPNVRVIFYSLFLGLLFQSRENLNSND